MSIIIGFVTSNCGLVSSDGRLTSGAFPDNGLVVKKAIPINDEFDKTFTLKNGTIIGAVAGTMEFQGRKIAIHLEEILTNECKVNTSVEDTLNCLKTHLKNRMEKIPENEILFPFRSIDLILIASPTGSQDNFKIYNSRFKPNSNNTSILIENEVISPGKKNNVYWKLFGDDSSQTAVDNFLKIEISKISKVNEQTLRSLSYKAVRHGIKNSTKHVNGDDLSCGGKPFVRSIK